MSLQKAVYGFVPTSITGCALWLDGADPAGTGVVPGTGTLATWIDKSGNGFNASSQLTAATSTQNAVNGLNSISFNGTSRYLTSVTGFNNSAYTIFVVQYTTSITGAGGSSGYQRTVHGSTGNQYVFIGTYNGNVATFSGSGSAWNDVAANSTNVYNYNSSRIVCMQVSGSILSPYTDGSSQTTKTGTTGSFSSFYIGNDNANTQPWYGFISEIVIYNSALGNTQRQQIEGYLAQKWGLTSSLPSSHPGRSTTLYRSDFTKQNVMRAIPYYTQFSPRQISGCSHWFDATDSSTITLSSGSLTQWNDKSGNGRNLTAVFANATVSSAYQNGLNVFNFSGNALYRTAADTAVYPQDVYIIIALKSTTTHVDVLGVGATNTGNFNSLTFGEYTASRWHNGSDYYNRTPNCISPTNETSTSFLLIQWSIANGNYLIRRNGTQLVQTATYSWTLPAGSIFQIGYRHPDNNGVNFSGYIGEIIVFNNQIGTSDRQNVESYLAQKWGLTASLPGGHSHATQPAGALTTTALTNFRMISRPRFLPTYISGIQLWLDAADSSSITGTTTVTQWRDKSGNTRHMGVGSGTTSYSSGAIQLTNSYMFVTSAVNLINVTVFIVVKTTGGNNQTVFSGRPNSNVNWDSLDGFGFYMDSTSAIRFYGQQPTGKFSTFSVNTSTPRLFSFKSTGTSVSGWYEGVSQTGGTLSSTRTSTAQGFAIGGEWQGSSYSNIITNASFYEIIVYNSDITDNQRQQIEGYLAWKWGLQASLPAGHPYLSAAP